MTVALDAGVLIGLLDPSDAHHETARRVFATGSTFWVHPVNLAEALVTPERVGLSLEAFEDLQRLGVTLTTLGPNEPLLLARMREKHRLRMPDACALALAVYNDIPLVTFDKKLASAASERGLLEPFPV
ncbi:PIN domain-containing protein [Leifsonia sp. fls2-241-R2A-40a]|uniref:type II toxin-antitoxin system VapC family toxin n=1 Tax=Leifsonia sp. fls2-241-R2A-40a TaxID=3040290 RepID=UPI00254E8515|nr:PIN domain-containing protein [Leifsonia sp. fls2-241-R2A-40a]